MSYMIFSMGITKNLSYRISHSIIIVFFFIWTNVIFGQELRTNRPTSAPVSPVNNNLGQNNPPIALSDSTKKDTNKVNTFKTLFKGKPGKAALYGLILPGGGQLYNKRWWKAPLAWGIDGWFTYELIRKKRQYNDFNKILENYASDPSYKHPEYTKAQAINFRTATRGNVEYAWVYLTLGHLFTVFEAYVDRHLMDFDVSNDLVIYPTNIPDQNGFTPALSFAYKF
jgi:hypothetical protein